MRATLSQAAKRFTTMSLLLCCAVAGAAQTTKEQQRGFTPGGSYTLGDIETVRNSNGNVMLNIPLAQLPVGRGGMPGAGLRLVYNSKLWDPVPVPLYGAPSCSSGVCTAPYQGTTTFLKDNKHGGWDYAYDYRMEVIDRRSEGSFPYGGGPSCNASGGGLDSSGAHLFKVRIRFPDGSLREFHPTGRTGLEETSGYYNVSPDGNSYYCQNVSGSSSTPNYAVKDTGRSIGTPNVYYSTDGTYLKLVTYGTTQPTGQITSQYWTLSFPDGTRVTTRPEEGLGDGWQRVYDRNGNFVQFGGNAVPGQPPATISDQLGRAVRLTRGAGEDVITSSGFGGAELRWVVRWRWTALRGKTYHAGQLGPKSVDWSFQVIDCITPPTQTRLDPYIFDYNDKDTGGGGTGTSVGWGELSSVTLPTGARALYSYKLDGVDLAGTGATQVLQNHPIRKELKYQSEYDGQSSEVTDTWRYAFNFPSEGKTSTGTFVTAPDGGVTSEGFINNPGHWDHGLSRGTTLPDGTTTVKVWQENRLGDAIGGVRVVEMNPILKTEYTTVPGSNDTSQTAIRDYTYDKNGNLLEVKEYDWVPYSSFPRDQFGNVLFGIPAGAVPKRVTKNSYHNPTPDSSTHATNANCYHKATSPAVRNALASTEVSDGAGQVLSRTEFTYDYASTTANLTRTRSWDSTKGALLSPQPDETRLDANNSVSVRNEYDDNITSPALRYGNVTLSEDANGNRTKYTYGAVFGPNGETATGLYPTTVVTAEGTAVQRTASSVYDFSTGLVTKVTDDDNQISTSTAYDALGRPRLVEEAHDEVDAGGVSLERQTVMEYDDALRRVTVSSDLNSTGDGKLVSVRHFDQLGRVRLSRTLEDASAPNAMEETTGIKVQTRYAYGGQNSYVLVSNPFRAARSSEAGGEETMGWTLTTSDRVGRVVRMENFAGKSLPAPFASSGANTASTGAVATAYDANLTTVTDQAGKQRRSVTDGLGRLEQVFEAPNADDYNYQTTYTYDANGNLKQVAQGTQTRTFVYSSLSRLVSATNPEICRQEQTQCVPVPVTYEYDRNGNLKKRTDPRLVSLTQTPIQTTYDYDEQNRLKTRAYNDGTPTVTYSYDTAPLGKGRLASVSSSVSTYNYAAYDALGRVTGSSQVMPDGNGDSVTYPMPEYKYNLAGGLVSERYPSGRVVKTDYDAAGRLAGVKDFARNHYYAGGDPLVAQNPDVISYTAAGAATRMRLGNGLWESTGFNSRLQAARIGLGNTAADSSLLTLDYTYGVLASGTLDPTKNNGNLQSQRVRVSGALDVTQTYDYDEVSRLKTAEEKAGTLATWKQVYSYDRYGNRTLASDTTTPGQLNGANNPSFNLSNNRISSAGYVYDSAGNLICDPEHPCGPAPDYAPYYRYDANNMLVNAGGGASYEYDGAGRRVKRVVGATVTVLVYNFAGQLVAEYSNQQPQTQTTPTSYMTHDHLGSIRVITGQNKEVKVRNDFRPFGEEVNEGRSGYGGGNVRQKFTSKERDAETGLDYFGARYYSSTHGRFTTCDPAAVAAGHVVNPQRWNLYVFVINNPLTLVDPDGRQDEGSNGSKQIDIFLANPVSEEQAQEIKDYYKDEPNVRVYGPSESTVDRVMDSLNTPGRTVIIMSHANGNLVPRADGRGNTFKGDSIQLADGYIDDLGGFYNDRSRRPRRNFTIRADNFWFFGCRLRDDIITGIRGRMAPTSTFMNPDGGTDGFTQTLTDLGIVKATADTILKGGKPQQARRKADDIFKLPSDRADGDIMRLYFGTGSFNPPRREPNRTPCLGCGPKPKPKPLDK